MPNKDKVNKIRIIQRKKYDNYKKLQIKGLYKSENLDQLKLGNAKHHLLRSSSRWSMGVVGIV